MERMDEILNRMKYTTQDRQNIKTGIEVLDARTRLLCKGQLTLLGSRPGMGKKSVAIQIAQFVAQQGRRVVWISTSLSKNQVVSRLISFPISDYAQRKILIEDRVTEIKEMDLMIRALEPLPDLVIIEQLQDLYRLSKSGNAVNDSEAACCRLKSLAQETHIAVLLLSQMSRAVERRKYHVPRPEDILHWQHIKKHLDTVCVFYRDGYYEIASNNIVSATFIIRPSTSCCGTVFSKWDVNRHCIVPLL
jgi:replicative DNA helicase